MPSNVEPHEAEAIRDLLSDDPGQPSGEVLDRDFHHPRRLGPEDFVGFTRQLQLELPDLETQLSDTLESACPLELGSISEINTLGLFADAAGPFAAITFEVQGQPAWIMWENVAAINAVEKILGSAPTSTEARRLSSVEVSMVERLLSIIADGILRGLGLEGSNLRMAQTLEGLGTWLDASAAPDPHRLHIEMPFSGPREPSTIHVYIPAPIDPNKQVVASTGQVNLPEHLDQVSLDVSVTLGGCDIMLNQLLDLEVGDVIPLDARVGQFASLNVEGQPHAVGTIGRKNKQVAIRIEHLAREQS